MVDASADETTPDCDCEMLALRASVLMLPRMREKKDSRSRDDPDARVDGASLFDAPDSAVPRRSRFAISDMRSSESRSVSSSSDDESSSWRWLPLPPSPLMVPWEECCERFEKGMKKQTNEAQ